jgi:hypothetical protein
MSAIDDYKAALRRLKEGAPERVPAGTRITNDAVALEAGRGKGTIKKCRDGFADLISDIQEAAKIQQGQTPAEKKAIKEATKNNENYKKMYEGALSREIALVREIFKLRIKIAELESRPQAIHSKNRAK